MPDTATVTITKPNLFECVLAATAVPIAPPYCRHSPQPLIVVPPRFTAPTSVCASVASRRDYSANHPYRQQQVPLHTTAVPGALTPNRRAGAETRPAGEGKPANPGKNARSQEARGRRRWIPKRKIITPAGGGRAVWTRYGTSCFTAAVGEHTTEPFHAAECYSIISLV